MKFRWKDRACTFLALLPVVGWFGFLFMGRRTGRRRYLRNAKIYGWISGILYFATMAVHLCDEASWRLGARNSLLRSIGDQGTNCVLLLALCWVVCLVHTMLSSGEYLQYLELQRRDKAPRDSRVYDRRWRRRSLFPLYWSLIPGLGGFALWETGRKLEKRGLRRFGVALAVLHALGWGASRFVRESYLYMYKGYAAIAGGMLGVLAWLVPLILLALMRESYLDALAREQQSDIHRQSNMADPAWIRRSTRWRIWTWFPIVGGIGITQAGASAKKRKLGLAGLALCLLAAVGFIGGFFLEAYRFRMQLFTPELFAGLDTAAVLLQRASYLIPLFLSQVLRWEVAFARANALQGYASEFDRDRDLYERTRARKPDIRPESPKPVQPERSAEPVQNDLPVTPDQRAAEEPEKLDINRATQAQLLTLPGVGLAQAKQAIAHREQNGPFRSLDEFGELLQLKPHFLVQLPRFARVDAPQQPRPAGEAGPGRRRIDI